MNATYTKVVSFVRSAIKSTAAFGKKNAPSIMITGSILCGWGAAYLFWTESKKAEAAIKAKEARTEEGATENGTVAERMSTKDRAIIYAQYCWPSITLGLGSTALAIGAHKIDLSRLAEMYVLTQFLEEKNGKQEKLIEKLKSGIKDKKFDQLREEILEEEYPKESVPFGEGQVPGNGSTLFIDRVTHNKFRADIVDVTSGINDFNKRIRDIRRKTIKKAIADPYYYAKDAAEVYGMLDPDGSEESEHPDIYSSLDLNVFLDCIGETSYDGMELRLGEVLEFRYYGGEDLISPKDIMQYKQYEDPSTGIPAVCFLDYTHLLSPTNELMERNPI